MGYKQKLGPLQRAGYDKNATTPFRQETDTKRPLPEEFKYDERNGELPTISAGDFHKLQSMGARGEVGGLLDSSYLKKVPGLEHYADKPGYWTINEEEAKKVRAYKASKKQ